MGGGGGSLQLRLQELVRKLMKPQVAGLVMLVCAAEAMYMLLLYQAFSMLSPVYVTSIKRGGGILLASAAGLLFGEKLEGRAFPVLTIVASVVMLCL